MAAEPREEVAAPFQGGTQVQAAVAPARGPDGVADVGPDDRGSAMVLRETRGDESDDADAPRPVDQGGGRRGGLVDHGPCLGQHPLDQVTAFEVGRLEGVGMQGGLVGRLGEQQSRGDHRLPHPAGRVEPGREREGDRLEVCRRRLDARAAEEGGDAGPRSSAQAFEPEPGDGPVLADDRRHVGDGPDGREVGQGEGRGGPAGHVGEQRLRDLEGDAGTGQPPVRVPGVRAMGVDERQRRRQDRGDAVVVGDDHVDAAGVRGLDLRMAGRAAVDRDDQPSLRNARRRRAPRARGRDPRPGGSGRTVRPGSRTARAR